MLADAATSSMGSVHAMSVINTPVATTARCGVCRLGWIRAKNAGRLWSLPIAKETREEA